MSPLAGMRGAYRGGRPPTACLGRIAKFGGLESTQSPIIDVGRRIPQWVHG